MACKTCNQKFQGVCDACSLVDSDNTFKEVVYCDTCDAYICKKCQSNWIKRAIAYFIEKLKIKDKPEQPTIEITSLGNSYVVNDNKATEKLSEVLKNITSKDAEGFPNEETV